jgi:hypothetical protein
VSVLLAGLESPAASSVSAVAVAVLLSVVVLAPIVASTKILTVSPEASVPTGQVSWVPVGSTAQLAPSSLPPLTVPDASLAPVRVSVAVTP